MITNNGKLQIKRYLAGHAPAIAQSVAIGIGSVAENAADTKLQFEVVRADVSITSFDYANNLLIFKANFDDDIAATINEIAVFSAPVNLLAGEADSRMLLTFDSSAEMWTDPSTGAEPTYVTSNSRQGPNSLRHAPSASATETDTLAQLRMDLSEYSGSDKFVVAYNVGNANTSNIRLRFMTDATNYYEISLGAQTAGYKITEVAKSTAVATGLPTWADITEVRVLTTSTSGGASAVDFDGLRIEDVDTLNPDYSMVARKVLATPFVKEAGVYQEVEFALAVTV